MLEEISKFVETQREEILYLQRNLVSLPALSPENGGDGEGKKGEFLLDYLKGRGFPNVSELPAKDPRVSSGLRPNFFSVIEGKNTDKTVWIVSHLDVVPPGDESLWDTDPFKLTLRGDFIYGRGVEDNHHGLVASVVAASSFLKTGIKPEFNLGLMFVSDEETGSKFGLDFVLKEHKSIFSERDEFLVPDFGSADSTLLEVAEKSMLWIKVIVEGKQCHASTPARGVNSLVGASAFILKLRKLYDDFFMKNELFDPPISTFEPTKKEPNVPNINTIPGKDVFYIDCRLLPEVRVQDVLRRIEEYKKEVEEELGVSISFKMVHHESSSFTSVDCFLVKRLTEAIETVYRKKARPRGIGGGTVAAFPRRYGYPSVAWATLLGTAHQPNEHTSINNIINDAKVMGFIFCPDDDGF